MFWPDSGSIVNIRLHHYKDCFSILQKESGRGQDSHMKNRSLTPAHTETPREKLESTSVAMVCQVMSHFMAHDNGRSDLVLGIWKYSFSINGD